MTNCCKRPIVHFLIQACMNFDTLIAVTNTSIFRHNAQLDVHWFPWKPEFTEIHEIARLTLVYQQIVSFRWFQLVCQVRFFLAFGTLPLTVCISTFVKNKRKLCVLWMGPQLVRTLSAIKPSHTCSMLQQDFFFLTYLSPSHVNI